MPPERLAITPQGGFASVQRGSQAVHDSGPKESRQ
jgi:hypothetical protein